MTLARRLAILAVALLATPSGVAAAAPAETPAPQPTAWGIAPSTQTDEAPRNAFVFTLDPGESLTDAVTVSNYTDTPLALRVYAGDAAPRTDGGFDLLPATQPSREVGAWVGFDSPTLTVPARSRAEVPFRLTVPKDANPGDHAGGVVASLTSSVGEGSGIAVERRVGVRIYARVTGTVDPSLTVDPLDAAFEGLPLGQPGSVHVTYTVRNDGNLRLGGRPLIRVAGPWGVGERRWSGEVLPEVLPGDTITGTATVDGVWQLGPVDVTVEIQPESSGGTVLEPAPAPGAAATRIWVVPWLSLAVLACALLVAVWVRRRAQSARARGLGGAIDSR